MRLSTVFLRPGVRGTAPNKEVRAYAAYPLPRGRALRGATAGARPRMEQGGSPRVSAEASGQVWGNTGDLTAAQTVVLLAVADVVNDAHGNEFYMRSTALGAKVGMAARKVRERLGELVEAGWLEVVTRPRGGVVRYKWVGPPEATPPAPLGPTPAPLGPTPSSSLRTQDNPIETAPSEDGADGSEDENTPSPAETSRAIAEGYWDWVKEQTGHPPPEPFMAVAKIAEAALKADFTRPQIKRGLVAIHGTPNRPITRQTLWAAMENPTARPGGARGVNDDWIEGAEAKTRAYHEGLYGPDKDVSESEA